KAQHSKTSFEEGLPRIKHLVVIYMENHSFDNLYGEFKGANGLENAEKGNFIQVNQDGEPYQFVTSDKPTPDVTHRFFHNQLQIDGGKMDKFAVYNDSKGLAMGYYNTEKLPLYPVAKKYTLCDNFFQSVFGGSYFNHVYL